MSLAKNQVTEEKRKSQKCGAYIEKEMYKNSPSVAWRRGCKNKTRHISGRCYRHRLEA